ncbi:hypothetical protein [Niallia endozanthoxylica]|uniref:ABC transporter periplasmic binding protein yphF n=1 Tax=Niallia endozanthoxylica TaxID=2036016 RepID=A0A5J5HYL8_9BACI|nr:hypothetical protein [Niallia endozanthoxylica]KAA9026134.1 hypothetical protein F4V44_09675 [Niallia endozanthoxylica]
MKRSLIAVLVSLFVVALSGCMYPEDKLVQNQIPYQDQVQTVQEAVTKFKDENGGILPIKNSEETTPIYQKYLIDFKKITPKYLSEPPGNAFESGGVFQYVIVNAENNPEVKMFDLRISEMISELKMRINVQGYPPYKERVAEGVYTLDYGKLGYEEEPFVISPYTNKKLPFVINGQAEIFVDYRSDLVEALKKAETEYQPGEDIRETLLKDSVFVPAYSLPYTVDGNTKEPIFLLTK